MNTVNSFNDSSEKNFLRIAIAQINLLVGDIEGNADRILSWIEQARDEQHADLIVFPELALSGYPPEDLLLRSGLYERIDVALKNLTSKVVGITALVGYPEKTEHGVFNAVAVLENSQHVMSVRKNYLPNYSVFDEKRYFISAKTQPHTSSVFTVKNIKIGVCICEDIWHPEPVNRAVKAGAQLILNMNASPFHSQKHNERDFHQL